MCKSIGKSTETVRCLDRREAWEEFWEKMARKDPTGMLYLLNVEIGPGAPENSSNQTESQRAVQETMNSGKRRASEMTD